jgi:hypothetical protein
LCRFASAEERKVIRKSASAQKPPATEGEYHTLTNLHKYCRRAVANKENVIVFYFKALSPHRRKAFHPAVNSDDHPFGTWRDLQNAFTIEFPSICIRALLKGYSTCGVLSNGKFYEGNYFWASCNHVAALPGLWDPINNGRDCDYFLFNVSSSGRYKDSWPLSCAYNVFDARAKVQEVLIFRAAYATRIHHLVKSSHLDESPHNRGINWINEPCLSPKTNLMTQTIVPFADRGSFRER